MQKQNNTEKSHRLKVWCNYFQSELSKPTGHYQWHVVCHLAISKQLDKSNKGSCVFHMVKLQGECRQHMTSTNCMKILSNCPKLTKSTKSCRGNASLWSCVEEGTKLHRSQNLTHLCQVEYAHNHLGFDSQWMIWISKSNQRPGSQ